MLSKIRKIPRGSLEYLRKLGISPTANDRSIRRLKGIHEGLHAVIVGNGPSLTIADLDRVSDQLSFGSNRVFLAFEKTRWRPTYYSVFDLLVAKNNAREIKELRLPKLLSNLVHPYLSMVDDALWIHEMRNNGKAFAIEPPDFHQQPAPAFSKDAHVGVESGSTVVFSQMQIAYFMGIKHITLLGIDFQFEVRGKLVSTGIAEQKEALVSVGEANHFHPDYRRMGDIWGVPRMVDQHRAFQKAKLEFERVGGSIVNASRKTALNVFPLMKLEDALSR